MIPLKWTVDNCVCKHENCDCDLMITLPERLASMKVNSPRYAAGIRQSKQDIILYAMAVIAANFDFSVDFVPISRNVQSVLTALRIDAGAYQNLTRIPPHFYTQNTTRPSELPVPTELVSRMFQLADVLYFARRGVGLSEMDLRRDVWRVADGRTWKEDTQIPSLSLLAARRASPYNLAVGGNSTDKPYTRSALADLHSSKFSKQVSVYGRNVKYLNEYARTLAPLMPQALDLLYRILGTKKYFGKYEFSPDDKYVTSIYLGASSGDAPGPELETKTSTGIPIFVSPRGKKFESHERAVKNVNRMLRESAFQQPVLRNKAWVMKGKDETYGKYDKYTEEDYRKYADKFRFFVIPSDEESLDERVLFTLRQNLERGYICIGHTWSYGGADRIAELLSYDWDNPTSAVYSMGDLINCDQSLHRVLLEFFIAHGGIYYNKKGPSWSIYKRMLKTIFDWLITRITHVYAGIWVIVYGGVPSGSVVTSHADSWVSLLLFCLWCCYEISRIVDAQEAMQATEALLHFQLIMIVYGDDLIHRCPRSLVHVFGFTRYISWARQFFDMHFKDIKIDKPLLSVVSQSGAVLEDGCSFLHRRLVLNPWKGAQQPRLLAWRPISDYSYRLVYGREPDPCRNVMDVMLSAMGMAYDSYAANLDSYKYLRDIFLLGFNFLKVRITDVNEVLFKHFQAKRGGDLSQYLRKGKMSLEELRNGFPKLDVLIAKNKVDREKWNLRNFPSIEMSMFTYDDDD